MERAAAARLVGMAAAVSGLVLAPFAAAADRSADLSPTSVVVDVGLGLALALSGLLGRPHRQGALVSLLGAAWLIGSVVGQASTLNRGVLLLVLLAFPSGAVRARWGWWPYVLAAVVASPRCPQLAVGLVFLAVAFLLLRARPHRSAQPLAGTVAVLAGLTQLVGAAGSVGGASELFPVSSRGYELVLSALALGFPWASRRSSRQLVDVVSGLGSIAGRQDEATDPLQRLAGLLGAALGDRGLRLDSWNPDKSFAPPSSGSGRNLVIEDDGRPVALLASTSSAVADPETMRAVTRAILLVTRNIRLLDEDRARVAALTASRARLVDAEDRERADLATVLLREVTSPVEALVAELTPLPEALDDPEARRAVELVLAELEAALTEAASMVSGLPTGQLGQGRLAAALTELGRRSPVPMLVTVDPSAVGDRAAETALYAVCAEALTNSLKHARASRLECRVSRDGHELVARVSDDGCGGADPAGRGLLGVADRLAARGGRLVVESPIGGGTTIEACVPASP